MSLERASTDDLRRSVVKLFTIIKKPNYYHPWELGYQTQSGGSGCIFEGRRILTNAHVVSDQVYVQVLKAGDTKKYTAKVVHVAHDSELALLTVEDAAFFDGTVPVHLGDLPRRQAKVAVCGFPTGGDEFCVTEGVVSRIEVITYTHSQRSLLAIQTDAAINPGNSGGPVFGEDGSMVGVAFQSRSGPRIESMGYAVPVPVISQFLEDSHDGVCSGVPALGVGWQKMESDTLREFHRMKPEQSGVLITKVPFGSAAYGALREWDVLTEVDARPVANDGTVVLRGHDRVLLTHVITQHQVGDAVDLAVLREGDLHRMSVTLSRPRPLVARPTYDVRPTYFVFAGLVFVPLSFQYMSQWKWKDTPPRFQTYYSDGLPSADRTELVLVSYVMPHEVNVGYHDLRGGIVERVNGVRITRTKDVIAAVERAVGRYHVIELEHASAMSARLVLDAAAARTAHPEILSRYGVGADRSPDLVD